MVRWIPLALLLSGCQWLLPFQASQGTDRGSVEASLPAEKGAESRAPSPDRSTPKADLPEPKADKGTPSPDRHPPSLSPCQQGWSGGWSLMGQSGVNCYANCSDSSGGYTLDCNWAGTCVCTGPGINRTCPTSDCETLANTCCCCP